METTPPGGSYTPPPPPPPGSTAPSPGTGELIYPSSPVKEPVVALLLNLLLLCVGYFWYGQWQKGVAALIGGLVLGVLTCGVGAGAVAVFTAIDGFMQAEQLKQGQPLRHWTFFNAHA